MTRLLVASLLVLAVLGSAMTAQEKRQKRPQAVTGELTKIDPGSVTITRRGDSGVTQRVVKIGDDTKIVIETDEDLTVKAEGGRTRTVPKTRPGSVKDLKVGQRVTVTHNEGKALSTRVLRAAKRRSNEGEGR